MCDSALIAHAGLNTMVRFQPEAIMKQPKTPNTAQTGKPLDPRQFPTNPQADATPGRDKVREVAHRATAPRQSKRPAERRAKSQTGT